MKVVVFVDSLKRIIIAHVLRCFLNPFERCHSIHDLWLWALAL